MNTDYYDIQTELDEIYTTLSMYVEMMSEEMEAVEKMLKKAGYDAYLNFIKQSTPVLYMVMRNIWNLKEDVKKEEERTQ